MHRLIVLMAQTFEWSETRIAAYLQAEGKQLSPNEVGAELQAAYHSLERAIPADMRAIYLDKPTVLMPSAAEAMVKGETDGLLTIEFDNFDL